jgi:Broad-minded protein
MHATFRLFRSPIKSSSCISPLHFISVVDPQGRWYAKWMISQLGRAQVVNAMQRCYTITVFVENFMWYVIHHLPNSNKPSRSDELLVEDFDQVDSDDFITAADLEYLHFLQLTTMIAKMVYDSNKRYLVPLEENAFR